METNNYSDEVITMLLFEATSVSATMLKDRYKQGAKLWFRVWWDSGKNLFKQLNGEIKSREFGEVAENIYDNRAAEIYEITKLSLEINNFELVKETLNKLKNG